MYVKHCKLSRSEQLRLIEKRPLLVFFSPRLAKDVERVLVTLNIYQ